jgi:ribose 5-phosphate isomerase B
MTIYLATDHAGFELKEEAKKFLEKEGHSVIDCGAFVYDPVDDYPDFINKASSLVSRTPTSRAFVFGGSGQGEAMSANRHKGVRCAVFYGPMVARSAVDVEGRISKDGFEMIKLEREHNDANILSFASRFVSKEDMKKAMKIFLETEFTMAERHLRRIMKF